MNNAAMAIGHDLKLDVVGINDELLDINVAVSEGFLGFEASVVKASNEAGLVVRRAHAAAAPAGHCFNHHRIANFLRDFHCVVFGIDHAFASRRHRHTGFACKGPRRVFVAHRMHHAGGRTDKLNVATFTDFREMRVLGQKTVAGMNGIDVAYLGCAHDPVDLQVTFRTRWSANANRFVGQLHVKRIDIGFGINRERTNPEFLASANDAERDLAAISNQNFFKHV